MGGAYFEVVLGLEDVRQCAAGADTESIAA